MTTRVPKRIDVNLMRARLGDKEAERLLMKLYTPMMIATAKVDPEHYKLTLAHMENGVHGKGGVRVPLVMRQWFAEKPRNANLFKNWLKEQILMATPPVEVPAVRRARKRRKAA